MAYDHLCNFSQIIFNFTYNSNQNFKLLMDSVEDYATKWVKQEEVELDTLSDWMTSIRSLIRKRIFKLSRSMRSKVYYVTLK